MTRLSRSDVARLLPGDNRLFTENIELASAVSSNLNSTLEAASSSLIRLPGEAWKIFVLYYGARIWGSFSGGIMLRAHGFNREAQYLDRASYEFYTKLLYYATRREEAEEAVKSFPKQHIKFIKKLKYEAEHFLDQEQMKLAESVIDYDGDANFTTMRERLMNDERFLTAASQPSVKFYLNEAVNRWNLNWILPSQVVHGTLMDLIAASKLDPESASVTGELDSLRPHPNGELLDSCQFAIFAAYHVELSFALAKSEDRNKLAVVLTNALKSASSMDAA